MHYIDGFAWHAVKRAGEISDIGAACHQGIRPLDRDSFHEGRPPDRSRRPLAANAGTPQAWPAAHGVELRPAPSSRVYGPIDRRTLHSVFGEIDHIELGSSHSAMKVAEDVPCITDRVSARGVDGKVSSPSLPRRAHAMDRNSTL